MTKNRLRAYFVRAEKGAEYGVAVVASSARETKRLAAADTGSHDLWGYDGEYTLIRCVWVRGGNIEGLIKGVVYPDVDALRRGLYAYLEDEDCPVCGTNTDLESVDGVVMCQECRDKQK
jgi:hypothetical protein